MEIVSTIAGRGVIGADKLPISLLLLIALGSPAVGRATDNAVA